MDFKFDVNKLFVKELNKITHTLIPTDFTSNPQELRDVQMKVSTILDDIGKASAIAQNLNQPVTSTSKLQDTDHIVYLLVDSSGNRGLGSILGFLKTGWKNLFLFDEAGLYHKLRTKCVLDFYVHESKQRMGLGKILYQHMLEEEHLQPEKLAIDRPSNKFLQFLQKHYGVHGIITQNNKFVVFKGFFDNDNP
ncbi:alpha-tubulin N-acetyltransferase-like isoform X4 [Aphidius gifuensis]|uniref:alpha-tubulin N-acetyltransferase-like isoform X4 n=1 Tax=Aphidius gifuensis TaxID=684658 RepID=UPI001CDB7D78|nr:alpha-tubulin N-acetyltransferase-like isoform X4 [Aphidius gifuensis]